MTGRETPRKLNVFVSYASEDHELAAALQMALQDHLDKDKDFAEIWIDRQQLRAGFDLEEQLKTQLDQTDILIVVYTGQQKQSHSFTGIEVGYFMATQRSGQQHRRIVPFYLTTPPVATDGVIGVPFGIDTASLRLSAEDFSATLQTTVQPHHRMVRFFRELEQLRDECRKEARLAPMADDVNARLTSVRTLLQSVFRMLRTRKEDERQPQKKVIVAVEANQDRPGEPALTPQVLELPGSTWLVPDGSDAMSIFGLRDEKVRWSDFITNAKEDDRYGWKDAIERVVISSLEQVRQLDVDNSQLVMSHDGTRLYRVVLSRSIKYYDGRREFHLYFVEVMRRNDFGNAETTRLLKALGLCCRFRFLFFENTSLYSADSLAVMTEGRLRDAARDLLKEMNLLHRDLAEARLDEAIDWVEIEATDWKRVRETDGIYQSIEKRMRRAANRILMPGDEELAAGKTELLAAVNQLTASFVQTNAELIATLAARLGKVVRASVRGNASIEDGVTEADRPAA